MQLSVPQAHTVSQCPSWHLNPGGWGAPVDRFYLTQIESRLLAICVALTVSVVCIATLWGIVQASKYRRLRWIVDSFTMDCIKSIKLAIVPELWNYWNL